MNLKICTLLVSAASLAACSTDETAEQSCQRTPQEPLSALHEVEIAEACAAPAPEQLTLRFASSPEAGTEGCEAALVLVAPRDFAAPRVSFGAMTNDGRYTGADAAVRDFLLADRLTNSSSLRLSADQTCDQITLSVHELRCRISAESDEDYQDCGPVSFEGTDMFGAFEPLEN
jgi:hypothetical protein